MSQETTPTPDTGQSTFAPSVGKEEFIAKLDDFDVIADLPSVWDGAEKLPPAPSFAVGLSAFSPETRAQLQERGRELNPSNPIAGTDTAIGEYLRRHATSARVRSMPESATDYQKEAAAQELESYRADQRADQIMRAMAQQRTVFDPVSGREIETGEPHLSPERLKALGEELQEISYRAKLLKEVEGPRRLRAAAERDYDAFRAREQAMWEAGQAKIMADKMLADERIKRQAEGIAKHRRGTIGV